MRARFSEGWSDFRPELRRLQDLAIEMNERELEKRREKKRIYMKRYRERKKSNDVD